MARRAGRWLRRRCFPGRPTGAIREGAASTGLRPKASSDSLVSGQTGQSNAAYGVFYSLDLDVRIMGNLYAEFILKFHQQFY